MLDIAIFDSTTKKIDSTNIVLGHSLLKVTGKKFGEKKALFDDFVKLCIQNFSNAQHLVYSKT